MEAGVNVLCEKPMSVTLEQGRGNGGARRKRRAKSSTIGFQPRYGANMRMVKELVRSGELGRVYYVQTGGGRRRGIPAARLWTKSWRALVAWRILVAMRWTWRSTPWAISAR